MFVFAMVFTACKNDQKTSEETNSEAAKNNVEIISAEYIYVADAAVLKGNDFIYGVELDSMAEALAKKIAPLKRNDFDMVPVVVQGKIKPNPEEEGWDEVVEIKKIIKVSKPISDSGQVIKVKGDTPPEK